MQATVELPRPFRLYNAQNPRDDVSDGSYEKPVNNNKTTFSPTSTQSTFDTETQRECILFPTYAIRRPEDASEWVVHAKGWALSHARTIGPRNKLVMGITKSFAGQASAGYNADRMCKQRFKYFLARNKRNKHLAVHAIGVTWAEQHFSQYTQQDTIYTIDGDDDEDIQDMASTAIERFLLDARQRDVAPEREATLDDIQGHAEKYDAEDEIHMTEQDALFSPTTDPLLAARPGNPLSSVFDGLRNSPSTSSDMSVPSLSSVGSDSTNGMTANPQSSGIVIVKTENNGHFHGKLILPHAQVSAWAKDQQQCDARMIRLCSQSPSFGPSFGIVNLVEPRGISIISDIDDTIKDTRILDGPRAVVANTFFKAAKAVDGMAETYMRWYAQGASFHYVSNSPFQLMPMLDAFLKEHQFPPGSMHLREEGSLLARLVELPGRAKRDAILQILRDFPQRQFILIGDSGEIDLEIYARIAAEHPGQILKILIRDVSTQKPQRRNTFSFFLKRSSTDPTALSPPSKSNSVPNLTIPPLTSLQSRVAKAQRLTSAKIHVFRKPETLRTDVDITDALWQVLDDMADVV